MTIQRIYIHLIDGTDVWVLVNAKQIQVNQFEISEDSEYGKVDSNELFEFFPGDVVELEERVLSDSSKRQVATRLISKGQWPDRKFNEFKYKAALNRLSIDKQTALFYQDEIERVKREFSDGKTFYPTIIEQVNKLGVL